MQYKKYKKKDNTHYILILVRLVLNQLF